MPALNFESKSLFADPKPVNREEELWIIHRILKIAESNSHEMKAQIGNLDHLTPWVAQQLGVYAELASQQRDAVLGLKYAERSNGSRGLSRSGTLFRKHADVG